ncbi:MAG: hypothetical protein MJZ75_03135 [Paludibacteraceae bacterium]|nr:hypothetical protein [Paludibacteraceae bacterium]
MKHPFFSFCCVCMLFVNIGAAYAESADDYLDKAKDYLIHWQPDNAISALEQCAQMSANDTAMLMTCFDYKAAAWCEKGDVYFFNEFGRQARDLWDEWQPDSEASIPWISNSVDGCIAQIFSWGEDLPASDKQHIYEQARQMMAKTYGEQSEHYQLWVQENQR